MKRSSFVFLAAWVLLTAITHLRGADGPVLARLREKLPVPGTVLIADEDPATMSSAIAEGSSAERNPIENAVNVPVSSALRVRVGKSYQTGMQSFPHRMAIVFPGPVRNTGDAALKLSRAPMKNHLFPNQPKTLDYTSRRFPRPLRRMLFSLCDSAMVGTKFCAELPLVALDPALLNEAEPLLPRGPARRWTMLEDTATIDLCRDETARANPLLRMIVKGRIPQPGNHQSILP